jgi:general secretion pathway protein H
VTRLFPKFDRPAHRTLTARSVAAGGFTLIEMMLVLAIIATATAASTLAFRGGRNQAALQPVVALVTADLRSARIVAMQRSRVVEIRFDGAARTYAVDGAKSPKRFPDNIGFTFVTSNDGLRSDYAGRLLFFPDGSSTGGALSLSSIGTNPGGLQRTIVLSVDWLTGSIRETLRTP